MLGLLPQRDGHPRDNLRDRPADHATAEQGGIRVVDLGPSKPVAVLRLNGELDAEREVLQPLHPGIGPVSLVRRPQLAE